MKNESDYDGSDRRGWHNQEQYESEPTTKRHRGQKSRNSADSWNTYQGIDVPNDSQNNGTIQLVPIANPTPPPGGIVVSSANVKSEPINPPATSVHIQPSVQYIQHDGVPVHVIHPEQNDVTRTVIWGQDGAQEFQGQGGLVGYPTHQAVQIIHPDGSTAPATYAPEYMQHGNQHAGPFSINTLMAPPTFIQDAGAYQYSSGVPVTSQAITYDPIVTTAAVGEPTAVPIKGDDEYDTQDTVELQRTDPPGANTGAPLADNEHQNEYLNEVSQEVDERPITADDMLIRQETKEVDLSPRDENGETSLDQELENDGFTEDMDTKSQSQEHEQEAESGAVESTGDEWLNETPDRSD